MQKISLCRVRLDNIAMSGSRSVLVISHKMATIFPPTKLLWQPHLRLQLATRRYLQSTAHPADSTSKALRLPPNLVDSFNQNVSWFNHQYEKAFGIAEIREMQNKVLEAESEFVDVTQQRKVCQDKIEHFKEEIKSIRDKLDITPRQSDNYLKLITHEHKLLREQLALDVQLTQLKEREQQSLDIMSKLLRQSHEVERLRQERAKYWQIISIALSLAGSLVALIAQRVRSQKSIMTQLAVYDSRLLDLDETIRVMKQGIDRQHETSSQQLSKINATLDEIALGLSESNSRGGSIAAGQSPRAGWVSWVPGLSTIMNWTGYYSS